MLYPELLSPEPRQLSTGNLTAKLCPAPGPWCARALYEGHASGLHGPSIQLPVGRHVQANPQMAVPPPLQEEPLSIPAWKEPARFFQAPRRKAWLLRHLKQIPPFLIPESLFCKHLRKPSRNRQKKHNSLSAETAWPPCAMALAYIITYLKVVQGLWPRGQHTNTTLAVTKAS